MLINKVIVYWEKAQWMNKYEIIKNLKKYYHTAKSFNLNIEFIDGDGSIKNTKCKFSFKYHDKLEDAINKEDLYILLEPEKELKNKKINYLKNYKHSKNATYIIWSEYGTIPYEKFKNKEYVTINTSKQMESLWSHIVLGIIAYDRWIKNGSCV